MRVEYAGRNRRFGIIAQRNMKDDSTGGAEYRVTMEREDGSWQITGLEEPAALLARYRGERRVFVMEGEGFLNR